MRVPAFFCLRRGPPPPLPQNGSFPTQDRGQESPVRTPPPPHPPVAQGWLLVSARCLALRRLPPPNSATCARKTPFAARDGSIRLRCGRSSTTISKAAPTMADASGPSWCSSIGWPATNPRDGRSGRNPLRPPHPQPVISRRNTLLGPGIPHRDHGGFS